MPENSLVYAIGDVHGRADLLEKMHSQIIQDANAHPSKKIQVIYLGDYIDRGAYVRETLDILTSGLPSGFRADYLLGNHEQLFMAFLEDPSLLELWLGIGGQTTLLSYGVQAPGTGFSGQRAYEVRDALLEAMPEAHLDFIRNLKLFIHTGEFLFVHAGIAPGRPLEQQVSDDLLWIRNGFLDYDLDHELKVVHGHTISEKVQEKPNRIGIDTGAYATGVLTCAAIDNNGVRYLSTASND